jgi:choline-sulfatase
VPAEVKLTRKLTFLLILFGISVQASPSTLLLTIDTLRTDILGCFGNPRSPAYELDRIAQTSQFFIDANTDIPLTLPSHTSLLSGRPAFKHLVLENGKTVNPEIPLLQECFKAAGYSTGAVIGGYPLLSKFGLERGFDFYDDAMTHEVKGHYAERKAGEVVSAAKNFLDSARGPVFFWVHFFDPHAPYEAPAPYAALYRDPYAAEVAYASHCSMLIRRVWEMKSGPGSIEVLVSDHGEALGDHNEMTHGVFLYQDTIHVPLMIRNPGSSIRPAGLLNKPVSISSVARMITKLAGLPAFGEQDSPEITALTRYPFDRYGWAPLVSRRESRWKFVRAPIEELYDLESDPGERHNIAGEFPEISARLKKSVPDDPFRDNGREGEIDADTRLALASLGYTSDASGARPPDSLPDPKTKAAVLRPLEEALEAIRFERWDKAGKLLEEVFLIDPDNPVANNNMGLAVLQTGQPGKAIPYLQKAARFQPDDGQIRSNLGLAYRKTGNYSQAEIEYRRAIGIDPGFGTAHLNLAAVLYLTGKNEEAGKELSKAISADPSLENLPAATDLRERLNPERSGSSK